MNKYVLTLNVRIESDSKLEEDDLEQLIETINEDFPTQILLNEDDWNEKQIDVENFEIVKLQDTWKFEDVD